MTENTDTVQQQQANLQKALWAAANDLRSNMDASEFRNYLLGMIFYRYLSQKTAKYVDTLLEDYPELTTYQELVAEAGEEDVRAELLDTLGYVVLPEDLFSNMIKEISANNFSVEHLEIAVNRVQSSTIGTDSEQDFDHLFDDMDLSSTRLGSSVTARSGLIAKVMLSINTIETDYDNTQIDVLGDAYEYLIGQFAASAGKKAGEFYTPQKVSSILAKLVTMDKKKLRNVYDPTAGSGSLLLRVGDEAEVSYYAGQELNGTTYNLARMNLLLHDVSFDDFNIEQGDTLENDKYGDQKFDAVVANPPYSANWNADASKNDDPRFGSFGKLAPKSKADFAFVETMLYHLSEEGTMAVVLPHGVLFRGAGEGLIRKQMIESMNVLDGVIGLPANLFYGTSIPTTILVFKKNRTNDDIFFIDASNDFEKAKNQNNLTTEHVDKIIATYQKREDVEKYAHKAELAEIVENDFNLNIPRYVDTFEEEEPIDLVQVSKELVDLNAEIKKSEAEFLAMLDELAVTAETKDLIEATREVFK
ncbi:type I restriction-modification system subunit M [Dellaglioa algida]|nr:type I restriction-modification system subunit M [Dellaglioa algida]